MASGGWLRSKWNIWAYMTFGSIEKRVGWKPFLKSLIMLQTSSLKCFLRILIYRMNQWAKVLGSKAITPTTTKSTH